MSLFRALTIVATLSLTTLPTLASAEAPKKEAKKPKADAKDAKAIHICPMCSDVKHEGPGSCPKCGMDLVKQEAPKK